MKRIPFGQRFVPDEEMSPATRRILGIDMNLEDLHESVLHSVRSEDLDMIPDAKRNAYTFQCHYIAADFGEEYVTVEADNQTDAVAIVDKWCEENNANTSQMFPPPSLTHISLLLKKR